MTTTSGTRVPTAEMSALLLANAAATLFMCGLIWFVQVVHYPLLAHVGRAELPTAHDRHSRSVTWLVLPPMSVELVTAGALALSPPAGTPAALAWIGLALAAALWAVTGLIQVPAHARVAREGAAAVAALVAGNWVRTALWTARAGVVLALLATAH